LLLLRRGLGLIGERGESGEPEIGELGHAAVPEFALIGIEDIGDFRLDGVDFGADAGGCLVADLLQVAVMFADDVFDLRGLLRIETEATFEDGDDLLGGFLGIPDEIGEVAMDEHESSGTAGDASGKEDNEGQDEGLDPGAAFADGRLRIRFRFFGRLSGD